MIFDSGLISFSGVPQPSQHIGIDPDGHTGLLWPIEFADDRKCVFMRQDLPRRMTWKLTIDLDSYAQL